MQHRCCVLLEFSSRRLKCSAHLSSCCEVSCSPCIASRWGRCGGRCWAWPGADPARLQGACSLANVDCCRPALSGHVGMLKQRLVIAQCISREGFFLHLLHLSCFYRESSLSWSLSSTLWNEVIFAPARKGNLCRMLKDSVLLYTIPAAF